jgi:hypothetical protein
MLNNIASFIDPTLQVPPQKLYKTRHNLRGVIYTRKLYIEFAIILKHLHKNFTKQDTIYAV